MSRFTELSELKKINQNRNKNNDVKSDRKMWKVYGKLDTFEGVFFRSRLREIHEEFQEKSN